MKLRRAIAAMSLGMFLAFTSLASNAESLPSSASTRPAATKPAGGTPKVIITIGDKEITEEVTEEVIDRFMVGAPEHLTSEQLTAGRKRIIDKIIEDALIRTYLKTVPCSDAELAAFKLKLSDKLRTRHNTTLEQFLTARGITEQSLRHLAADALLKGQAGSDEKITACIRNNPAYFDGTSVRTSHVLISCDFYASPDKCDAARRKLQRAAANIKSGKISFADAARRFSTCPSAKNGGDLGAFTFEKMVPPFSKVAFATKVGEIGEIVRTCFGFHLIKVTSRTEGRGKPETNARQIARAMLLSQLHSDILRKALKANPVTVAK